MTSENEEQNAKENKECIRCKGKKSHLSNTELLKCGNVKCEKLSHYICFEKKYNKSSWFQDLKESNSTNEVVYCNKDCYSKGKNNKQRYLWNNDGLGGKDDPNNSLKLLIDWLTTGENWTKYKGKNNNGKSKLQYSKEIASVINSHGVKEERTADQVRVKIDSIERAYKEADVWVNRTGVGVKEEDVDNFEDIVRTKYCQFYFELEPIFKDHASIRPKLTSNELDSDTDDSEESEEDLSEDPFASTNSVESQNVNSNRDKNQKGVKRSASSDMKNKSKSKFKTEHISTSKMDQYLESKKKHCETKIEAEKLDNKIECIHQIRKLDESGYSECKIRKWLPELLSLIDIYFDEDD